MAGYVAQIPDWFSVRRAAQVCAFFLRLSGDHLNVLKLTKLVYISDRWSMDRREYPITGDNFVSMPFGPVNTFTYSLIQGSASSGLDVWRQYIAPRQRGSVDIYLAKGLNDSDFDELSNSDRDIMTEVWEEFKDIDRFVLAEWTHKYCPEWINPHGSSLPIEFATVYKKLSKTDPIELVETIQANRLLYLELTQCPDEESQEDGDPDQERERGSDAVQRQSAPIRNTDRPRRAR